MALKTWGQDDARKGDETGVGRPCLFDGTRACSKQAKLNDPTPAGALSGPKGCAVVTGTDKIRKAP